MIPGVGMVALPAASTSRSGRLISVRAAEANYRVINDREILYFYLVLAALLVSGYFGFEKGLTPCHDNYPH